MVMSINNGIVSPLQATDARPRRSKDERKKRAANRRTRGPVNTLVFHPFFLLFAGLLMVSVAISFFLVLNHPEAVETGGSDAVEEKQHLEELHRRVEGIKKRISPKITPDEIEEEGSSDDNEENDDKEITVDIQNKHVEKKNLVTTERYSGYDVELTPIYKNKKPFDTTLETPHLIPKAPVLPIFAKIDNGEKLIDDLLHNNKPTIAGIIAYLQKYLEQLHDQNKRNSKLQHRDKTGQNIDEMFLINSYFNLTEKVMDPLEDAYRGRTIFPVREDGSLFVSLAAFREHLLGKSMMSAFDKAKDPSKLFIGAVVQNCFGLDGVVCKTGLEVIGKDKNGHDMTSVSPKPPDENGIEEFCNHPDYKKYCDSGQVRVVYLHDTDALGPQTARFYASKLWGGETYFMQMDAHLEFAPDWDEYYISEVKASKNYPKSILSAYPPGFREYDGAFKGGGRGERLCGCHFSTSPVENQILRIEQLGLTPLDAKRPTQIPFIAAGFFFAHSAFLGDVPFDPYAPWCFMGEEIALSIRAWTNGWNIYAPRKNVIAHQYRPGRLGLPKFWESVGRDSGRASLNTRLQKHVLRRVKHMLTYPSDSREKIKSDGDEICLHNFEHYSLGHERKLEDYLQMTTINPSKLKTGRIEWCLNSSQE